MNQSDSNIFFLKYKGKKIHMLTILEKVSTKGKCKVMAKCDCEKMVITKLSAILSGNTQACGCLNTKRITTHGMTHHPLYGCFECMVSRCYDNKNKKYRIYGGRGVSVCHEWLNNKENFFKWALSNGWKNGMQIDKDIIPKKLGIPALLYSPEMCTIVTPKVNNRNKSNSSMITHKGETMCVADWAEKLNISPITINARIRMGWDREISITKPIQKHTKRWSPIPQI